LAGCSNIAPVAPFVSTHRLPARFEPCSREPGLSIPYGFDRVQTTVEVLPRFLEEMADTAGRHAWYVWMSAWSMLDLVPLIFPQLPSIRIE
jgi:hypothetical protein